MYITNVTNDYDNITCSNYSDYDNITSSDYDNMTLSNCTNIDTNIEEILPFFTIIPYTMSLVCLISLMAYTLVKPFFIKNKMSLHTSLYINIFLFKFE